MQEEGAAAKEDNVLRVLGLQAARNTAPVRKFAPKQRPASECDGRLKIRGDLLGLMM